MTATPAGLDVHTLRGIAARRRGPMAYQQLLDRIAEHLDEHDGFVSWSGGKDSTVVVDLARQVDPHVPVVFFDSGLQFPETIQYLEDLAEEWRLNYHVIAADPDLLTVLIAGGGFSHEAPDRRLRGQLADIMITGPATEAHRRYGRGSLWGVRAEESHGRRMLYRRGLAAKTRARQQSSRDEMRAGGQCGAPRRRHHHLRADLGLATLARLRVPGRPTNRTQPSVPQAGRPRGAGAADPRRLDHRRLQAVQRAHRLAAEGLAGPVRSPFPGAAEVKRMGLTS
jgi:hypothetical protein